MDPPRQGRPELPPAPDADDAEQISSFLHVTSKESFGPILHSLSELFSVDNSAWPIFKAVNRSFARAACEEATEGATIWLHAYNYRLSPGYIRAQRPDVPIAFFHHTPFPSNDAFGIMPWRDAILDSLLSCDLVGFPILRYAKSFARNAMNLRGVKAADPIPVDVKFRRVGCALAEPTAVPWLEHEGRRVHLLASPVGNSPPAMREIAASDEMGAMAARIAEQHGSRKLILLASRGVELFLACVAAATGMRIYEDIQRSVEEIAGRTGGRFGRGRALVLSEFTGVSVEVEQALLTNPSSHRSMDAAILAAVETFTVQHWAGEQLLALRAL